MLRRLTIFIFFLLVGVTAMKSSPLPINREFLHELEQLMDNGLRFSKDFHIEDILSYEEELIRYYQEKNDEKHLMLTMQMVNYAKTFTGDTDALDDAKAMLQLADSLDYPIGEAIAHFSIGDCYLNTSMVDEALESYKQALKISEQEDGAEWMQANALKLLVPTLINKGDLKEAEEYLQRMERLYKRLPALNDFSMHIYRYYYHISNYNLEQMDYELQQAEKAYELKPYYYHYYLLLYMQAQHDQSKGNYEGALEKYRELIAHSKNIFKGKGNLRYIKEMGKLYTEVEKMKEACEMYQLLYEAYDSISNHNYVSKVNLFKTLYQVDTLTASNTKQWNRVLFFSIVGVILIMLFLLFYIIQLIISNRRVKVAEQQLLEARETSKISMQNKSLLLSNMSHEIRTPLNALSGFSSILTDMNIDNETRLQCYDIIQQNSDLLLKLIDDVVDLSNLEIGKMQFQYGWCDAVSICRNVVDTVEKIKQTAAAVWFETELEELELYTDMARLQQLLINLLINATKFTSEGSIVLKLEKQSDDMVRFLVTDTGCGIAAEKQDSVFNRFEKLNEQAQGSGLGLSICRLIIEQLNGEIWLDKEYTGGCRFIFTHPIKRKEDRK